MTSPNPVLADNCLGLWLLGGFRVAAGSQVIEPAQWRRRKASALLKILALHPGHQLHREQVIELLWPEATPEAGANSFHQALHLARQSLAPAETGSMGWLRLENDLLSLALDEPVWTDVEAFEAAAAEARRSRDPALYRRALDLYGGELLPEDRFAEWAMARRQALQEEYIALQLGLAEICKGMHAFEIAIRALKDAIAAEPTHEPAHRGLMELYALKGQPEQALAQYERLRSTLRDELAVEPDSASQRLFTQIRSGALHPPHPDHVSPPNNLPVHLTSFIGREGEMASVGQLLAVNRLVTVTGPGGCGKTRLALKIAGRAIEQFTHGVWFVDLGSLSDPAYVPQAVARVLGVPEAPGKPIMETLCAALRSRALLLVLDNCEHLSDACAALCEALLQACSQLQVLATSREALHLAGEVVWLVPSLALPDPEHLPSLPALAEYAAVRLFVERSRAVQSTFVLTAANAAAVARLCYHLDGIPLAIELAAARMNVLTAEQILARLDDRFQLLTRGSRTALNRQQTLQAAIDWSYDLLAEPDRLLFQRLTVFAGGWRLGAAERVAGDASAEALSMSLPPAQILESLSRLVDQSLVVVDQHGNEARYRMLETIREYACRRLDESGEANAMRERHSAWCLELLERVSPRLWGADHDRSMSGLDDELENIRAALAWCVERDADAGLHLAHRVAQFWVLRGYVREGQQWLQSLLSQAPKLAAWRAKGLVTLALLKVRAGDIHGEPEDLVTGLGSGDDIPSNQLEQVWTDQIVGGLMLVTTSQERASRAFESSLALAQGTETGTEAGQACAIHCLGVQAGMAGDYGRAHALLEESEKRLRRLEAWPEVAPFFLNFNQMPFAYGAHSQWWIVDEETLLLIRQFSARSAVGFALANRGSVFRAAGDVAMAAEFFEASRAHFASLGDQSGLGQVLGQLGYLYASAGDWARARQAFETSLSIRRGLGDQRGIGRSLGNLAHGALLAGDYTSARNWLDESLELFQQTLDKPGLAQTFNHLGNWALEQNDFAQAQAFYEKSLQLFNEFGPRGAGRILLNLAACARGAENSALARQRLDQAWAALTAYGDWPGAAACEIRQK